ncbi:MAG: N-acetylglucosamine-6-phosphate deacetylase [Atopobiaceae bacterium]|nr:N-acetylglucosamine-6-phosphate deacetylase [Atopobiaceae bacterium]
MSTFAIKSDHLVLPNDVDGSGYLLVADGRFAGVTEDAPEGVEVIDRTDCWVAPGFFDTHIHGFVGHDVMDCDPEAVTAICEELVCHGTTSWLATTLTASVEQTGEACASVAEAVRAQGAGFVGTRTQGIFLEGPFFTEEHKGAQNPKYLIDPEASILDGWQERAGGLITKSALAPERDGTVTYVEAMTDRGVTVALGHTSATSEECLAAVEAGARVFVHTYNGMADLLHRNPGPVGCAMTTPETYSELICDGMHVHPIACKALVHAKGWEHVALITDCLSCGGLEDGDYYLGELPIELRGGAAYLKGAGNLAGSTLTLAKAVQNVVGWGMVSPSQALRMASEIPARSVNMDDRCGVIATGRLADLVVMDQDMTLVETYLAGQLVSAS